MGGSADEAIRGTAYDVFNIQPVEPAERRTQIMKTIRNTVLTAILTLVIAAGAYLTAVPMPAMAAQTAPAGCPVAGASMLTTQQLRAMLDARYLYRVGLPR